MEDCKIIKRKVFCRIANPAMFRVALQMPLNRTIYSAERGAKVEYRNKNLDISSGVYEAEPIIMMPNGTEYIKTNNNGKSTFFPDSWNESRILDEVEYAIQNNHGKLPSKPNGNEYYGYSRDGKVEIHFYLGPNSSINSFFPYKN